MKHKPSFLGMLLHFFWQCMGTGFSGHSGNIKSFYHHNTALKVALATFFDQNPPEIFRYFTLMISQCWSLNDCKFKREVSDKDFDSFLEQLNDLVTATYQYHKGFCDTAYLKMEDSMHRR